MIPAENLKSTARQEHICIVTETFAPEVNGVALTLVHLVKGLRQQGHAVSLVRPRQDADGDHPSYDSMVTLVSSVPLPGYRSLRIGLPARGIIERRWTQHRPDVVYVATEGPLGWSAVRVARRLAIPVFSGFHTNFHSYLKHYHAGSLRFLTLRYLRSFHRQTMGTLVPNVELRDQLRAMGITNVSVVGRGVDSRLFHPQRRSSALRRTWRAAPNELVALYVGRVAPEKNLGLAVEAYHAMRQFDSYTKFVVVGDGPLRATLQTKYPDIIFCGVHTDEQLAKRYASADMFLFPSETETFGNVTLEAMASGLVVVAYDYAAARMHIVDGHTGMLVPYKIPKLLLKRPSSSLAIGKPSSMFGGERATTPLPLIGTEWSNSLRESSLARSDEMKVPALKKAQTQLRQRRCFTEACKTLIELVEELRWFSTKRSKILPGASTGVS